MITVLRLIVFLVTTVVVSLFSSFLGFTYFLDIYKQWLFDDVNDFQLYDFIVVGAGTAGATLATRLSKHGHETLLLEAGGTAPPFSDIPLLAPLLQNTPYSWGYLTIPQENACKALNNNQSKWPTGKLLGGTSKLNYMLYVRGHPFDYKDWIPEFDEYFTKSKSAVQTSDLRWNSGLADAIFKGLQELNQDIGDINDNLKNGFMKAQLYMENGRRWSTDKMLYNSLNGKLTVVTHAQVKKVLMESNTAVGVQFLRINKIFTAIARKGIILSAGAIGSPKILMLSGIGPRKHLENLQIKVINDLPVGQRLVDHILTGIDLIELNVSVGLSTIDTFNPISALNYFLFGEGPWTFSGVELLGTFYSSLNKTETDIPDLQIMVMPLSLTNDGGVVLKDTMGITDKVFEEYFSGSGNENRMTIAPILLHPKSKGEVKLSSSNFLDPPLIDPKYLSHKDDIATLVKGLQFVKKLVNTNALKAFRARVYKKHIPGCEHETFDTEKYWKCYIQHLTLSSYHPAGTCSIGHVVDKKFKVYGTRNLYVVDASVLPSLPSGNINAAVMAVSEKAAQTILESVKDDRTGRNCYKANSCYLWNHFDWIQTSTMYRCYCAE